MARPFVKTFTRRLIIISHILVVILMLLACANMWLHPDRWWFIAVLGLAFPFLLLLDFLFLLLWLFFRSRWVFLGIVSMLLAAPNINALIGFHFKTKFKTEKAAHTVRLLTWNVMWFAEQKKSAPGKPPPRKEMLRFIADQNADILCFQEYLESNIRNDEHFSTSDEIARLGYPYHYVVGDYILRRGSYNAGVAIFSKYPITDTVRLQYPGPVTRRAAESLISADININGQTIRVFTTHLQSILLKQKDYRDLQIIRNAQDSLIDASKSILKKLKQGYSYRGYQADLVRQRLDQSPYPVIICGDFNDVPNSYAYWHIRGNRKDAFNEAGTGIGRSFSNISPTLRIDYILTDKGFNITQYKCTHLPYSDHYPVIADLEMPKSAQ